jgi:phosphoribosylformylglycinamidine synthase
MRADALCFGETQSRIVVTTAPRDLDPLLKLARDLGITARMLGRTGGDRLILQQRGRTLIDVPVREAYSRWKMAIPDLFEVR